MRMPNFLCANKSKDNNSIICPVPSILTVAAPPLHKDLCEHCSDLLSRIHANRALLTIEHASEMYGSKFWRKAAQGCTSGSGADLLGRTADLSIDNICRVDEFAENVMRVEHEWQRALESGRLPVDDNDYWRNNFRATQKKCAAWRALEARSQALDHQCSDR